MRDHARRGHPRAWLAWRDPTFGVGGVAVASFGGASSGAATVTRQTDGKLVAAGGAAPALGGPTAIAVARFDASGAAVSSLRSATATG